MVVTMVMIAASAFSATTPSVAAEPRLILPDGALSLSQISSMSTSDLTVRIADAAGANVVVNRQELARTLSSRGDVLLPVAAMERADTPSLEVGPTAIPNDEDQVQPTAGRKRAIELENMPGLDDEVPHGMAEQQPGFRLAGR